MKTVFKITAYLHPDDVIPADQAALSKADPCNFSKHFVDNWIKNDSLLPECKAIPVERIDMKTIPEVQLLDQNGKLHLRQVGININPAELQGYVKNHLGIKTL